MVDFPAPEGAEVYIIDPADGALASAAKGWWEQIWDAREAASFSERDSLVTSTIGGAGCAPSDPLDVRSACRLRERFERWHNDASFRRMNGAR
jgi:hypothetical protein